jgi:hypothetical protein
MIIFVCHLILQLIHIVSFLGHVNDVCDDSLDGGNIVQQNISPDRTHQQEEEKKQEAPVVRSNDKQKLS